MFWLRGYPVFLPSSSGVADAAVAVRRVCEDVRLGGLAFDAGHHFPAAAFTDVGWGVAGSGAERGWGDTSDHRQGVQCVLVASAPHPGLDDVIGGGAQSVVEGGATGHGFDGAFPDAWALLADGDGIWGGVFFRGGEQLRVIGAWG